MADPTGRPGWLRLLRWGIVLLIGSMLLVVAVPSFSANLTVGLYGHEAAVRTIRPWTLPALSVSFSAPPSGGDGDLTPWLADQLGTLAYVLLWAVYYAGVVGATAAVGLIAVAVRRARVEADALGR